MLHALLRESAVRDEESSTEVEWSMMVSIKGKAADD